LVLVPQQNEEDSSAAEPQKHELSMLMSSKKKLKQYPTRLSDVSCTLIGKNPLSLARSVP
jgi:hypothetical protein